jgi:hypothetical protein
VRGHNLLLALSIAFAAVATSQEVFAEASPSRPAVLVKTMTMDEVVQPDGSYTTLFHVERLATNQSAAQKIAQQTVEYSESMETAEIEEALTRKADGNVLKVDRTQIFAQAPPGSPQVPMFTDRKQKVIVFPALRRPPKVRFASDSPLEGEGFETSVPVDVVGLSRVAEEPEVSTGQPRKAFGLSAPSARRSV